MRLTCFIQSIGTQAESLVEENFDHNKRICIVSIEGGGPEQLVPFVILEQLEEMLKPLQVIMYIYRDFFG